VVPLLERSGEREPSGKFAGMFDWKEGGYAFTGESVHGAGELLGADNSVLPDAELVSDNFRCSRHVPILGTWRGILVAAVAALLLLRLPVDLPDQIRRAAVAVPLCLAMSRFVSPVWG
jgi:hypothetical protein